MNDSMNYGWENFGNLKSIVVRPKNGLKPKLTILLFHGYGANAKDLASLALMSSLQAKWIFPQGPLSLDPMGESFSWFPLNYEEWLEFSKKKDKIGLATYKPQGIDKVCKEILFSFKSLNLKSSNLILGGFSQGSSVTVETLSRMKEKPKAIVIFSGTLMNEKFLSQNLSLCEKVSFFQSHGIYDQVLPLHLAKKLESMFRKNKMKGNFEEFSGGHEIPHFIFKKFETFVKNLYN